MNRIFHYEYLDKVRYCCHRRHPRLLKYDRRAMRKIYGLVGEFLDRRRLLCENFRLREVACSVTASRVPWSLYCRRASLWFHHRFVKYRPNVRDYYGDGVDEKGLRSICGGRNYERPESFEELETEIAVIASFQDSETFESLNYTNHDLEFSCRGFFALRSRGHNLYGEACDIFTDHKKRLWMLIYVYEVLGAIGDEYEDRVNLMSTDQRSSKRTNGDELWAIVQNVCVLPIDHALREKVIDESYCSQCITFMQCRWKFLYVEMGLDFHGFVVIGLPTTQKRHDCDFGVVVVTHAHHFWIVKESLVYDETKVIPFVKSFGKNFTQRFGQEGVILIFLWCFFDFALLRNKFENQAYYSVSLALNGNMAVVNDAPCGPQDHVHTLKEDGSKYRLKFVLDRKELTVIFDDFRTIFQLPQAIDNNHERFVSTPKFLEMVPFFLNDLGFTLELRSPSNFKTTSLIQPWQTLCKMFLRCLTTRITGYDQPPLQIMQMLYCFINNVYVDYADLLWEGLHDSLEHLSTLIPYPRFTKLIISHYMTAFLKISKRVRQLAPLGHNPDINEGESSAQRKFTVIRLHIPPRWSTRLIPPTPIPTAVEADDIILQDTIQLSITEQKSCDELEARKNVKKVEKYLIAEEIEKLVKGTENVDNDEVVNSVLNNKKVLSTRLEPRSHTKSPEVEKTTKVQPVNTIEEEEESAEDDYELRRMEKGKNVEDSRHTPSP
ncbi:hypothetical protein Tco_1361533, partial [Tanacetum coccineum]